MPKIKVTTVLDVTPEVLWNYVQHIDSHTQWMKDAHSISFTSTQRQGVGTTFDCLTKVGPISLNDKMEITRWEENVAMGVTHSGIVTGVGEFLLTPLGENQTFFSWEEELFFPWWMGGPLGAFLAKPVLRLIWKQNLALLKQQVE